MLALQNPFQGCPTMSDAGRVVQFGPRKTIDDELNGIEYGFMLQEPEPDNWMVDNCFLAGEVGIISGNGGAGKSSIMQQLATCAVLGLPWLGFRLKAGKALMLACEDTQERLKKRQYAINKSLARHMEDVLDAGLDLISRVTKDNILLSLDRSNWRLRRESLMDKLVTRCCRTGVQYVIIDTITKTFGGNQSDPRHVTDYINEMQRLAIAINGVVILTQHPSMRGRMTGTGESGSVQWENSVRARLYLHSHKTQGLILEGMKANYSEKPKPLPLVFKHGVFAVREPEKPRDYTEPTNTLL